MTNTANPNTLTCRLAVYFTSHAGEWIDGRQLASIGGAYAWRTRLSELRRPPYNLRIDNRQRRVKTSDETTCVVSEYCFVPDALREAA